MRYIIFHKSNLKNLKIFKNLTLIVGIICFLLGFYFCIIIWLNTIGSPDFSKECAFNYSLEELENIFSNYLGDNNTFNNDLKTKCKNRKCILFDENLEYKYPYQYLCNYDASQDFINTQNKIYTRTTPSNNLFSSDEIIKCQTKNNIYATDKIGSNILLNKYVNICHNTVIFYNCSRFYKPKEYPVDEDDVCPNSQYFYLLYILCVVSFIIDIIIVILPWIIEYFTYKKLVNLYRLPVRISPNSVNPTNRSSEINRSGENNEGNFKKEDTEYIIVEQQSSEQKQQQKIQPSLITVAVNDAKNGKNNNQKNNNNQKIIINEIIKEEAKEEDDNAGTVGCPSVIKLGNNIVDHNKIENVQSNFAKKKSVNMCLDKNSQSRDSARKLIKINEDKSISISSSNGLDDKNNEKKIINIEKIKEEKNKIKINNIEIKKGV